MNQSTILVVGATGLTGRLVVTRLAQGGHRVRAMARDLTKLDEQPGVERVQADLSRPETLPAAFDGVARAYVVTAAGPEMATLEGNAFAAARRAGVQHVVNVSAQEAFMPHLQDAPLGRWVQDAERRLADSDLPHTILRPGAFASNILTLGALRGELRVPAGDGLAAPIDPDDIAAVAVEALTTSGHAGNTYTLTGPALIGFVEMTEIASSVVGRPLRYTAIADDEARNQWLAAGLPKAYVESMIAHFRAIRDGRIVTADGVAQVLGRPARSFRAWAKRALT